MDFQPEALKNPMEIDIDGFLEHYLGATPDYQYLSHNMIYLGMTVFQDTNRIPVYDPYHDCAVLSILDEYGTSSYSIINSLNAMAEIFNVSHEAVLNRLRNLGFVKKSVRITIDDIMVK